ncbi:MAG: hemerythrin domain-containing protein [Nannocystaceae bacterium]
MNIYERLKEDHDRHRQLAAELVETSGDSEERRALWKALQGEVEAHAAAEEQSLYATLLAEPKGHEKARHSVSEHKEAADLIDELADMDMSSPGWLLKFRKLKEELEHHMDEEESEVFARSQKILSERTAKELARTFEARKAAEL